MATRRRGTRKHRSRTTGVLFVLPAVVLLAIFLVYPVIATIRLSLDTGIFLQLQKFIGLDNYRLLLLHDRHFLDVDGLHLAGALVNNALWFVLYVGGCLGLGLLIAALGDRVRYEGFVKSVVFAPQAIAATAAGLIWLLVYAPNPRVGVLNAALSAVGLEPVGFLGLKSLVNIAIIVAAVWSGTGLAVIVLSAAIKSVPREISEAAALDGASPMQTFRHVTLPMISGPLTVVTVTLAIAVIKVFDIVFVMTRGGPDGASGVIGYTFYDQTFQRGRGGYGAAAAVLMLVLVLPIMLFNIRQFKREESRR